ncbi:MAG: 4Fe-4S ferredoxin, partial [bacterium]|nr:4Fe-4S ferredoxin [bacterium]
MVLEYMDVAVLVMVLSLASYFVLRVRSRRKIFLLMIFSLVYFGFYREGCVCAVGAVQNVSYALFNPGYIIPITAVIFFVLP